MIRRTLIIFAKPPRFGISKRRLAADIGMVESQRIYRSILESTIRRFGRDARWKSWLFVDVGAFRWPSLLPRMPQVRGDLGYRMNLAFQSLPPGPAVLIGSDIPNAVAGDVWQAFQLLGRKNVVFGCSADGGYWLVGVAHKRIATTLFNNVRWSTEFAFSDTLNNLKFIDDFGFAPGRQDVDDGISFQAWKANKHSF